MATVLAAGLFIRAAHAQTDTTVLLNHKAWQVSHKYFHDTGKQACVADTINPGTDYVFTIAARDDGSMTLIIVSPRPLCTDSFQDDLGLAIDYEPWTLADARFDRRRSHSRVAFEFEGTHNVRRFFTQLMDGRAVAIKDASGQRNLIDWSLADSAEAMLKMMECSDRIGSPQSYGSVSGYGQPSRRTGTGYGGK